MKRLNPILNVLTAIFASIGGCAAVLSCFIIFHAVSVGESDPPDSNISVETALIQSESALPETVPIQRSSQSEDPSTLILPSEETQDMAVPTGAETIDVREDGPQTVEAYQPETTVDSIPLKYYQALNRANAYSDTMHMSKTDIYDQLVSAYGDNFSADAAQYAVDHLTNVWEPEEQELVPTAQDSAETGQSEEEPGIDMTGTDNASQQKESVTGETSSVPEPEVSTPAGMVWLSETGEKYHCVNDCGRMNPDRAILVTLEEALSKGIEKCKNCY